jgi:hypothetical protein
VTVVLAGDRQVDESCQQVCSNVPNAPDAQAFVELQSGTLNWAFSAFIGVHVQVPCLPTHHTAEVSMLLQRLSQAGSRTALLQRAVCISSMRAALPLTRRCAAAAASATEAPPAAAEPAPAGSGIAAYPAPAYKVNLDFKFIRDNLQLVTDNCKIRDSAADPALVAQLYDDYVKLKAESDNLRSSRNENSAAMKVSLQSWPMAHSIRPQHSQRPLAAGTAAALLSSWNCSSKKSSS